MALMNPIVANTVQSALTPVAPQEDTLDKVTRLLTAVDKILSNPLVAAKLAQMQKPPEVQALPMGTPIVINSQPVNQPPQTDDLVQQLLTDPKGKEKILKMLKDIKQQFGENVTVGQLEQAVQSMK